MSTAAAAGSAAPASPFLTLDESKEKLPAVLARSPKVLAYFTAAWCGPCKAIAPHFAALAKEHGSAIQFVKVDIDDNADATEMEGISSVPTFKSFLNGKVTAQFSGANVETLKASAKALAELK